MTKKQRKNLIRIIAAAVLVAGLLLLFHFTELPEWTEIVLYLIPYFAVGYDVLIKAAKGIRNRQVFDENFLMAVATVGAFCLGECLEGVAVMLFYQVGELFQSVAVGKSRKNIAALMDIRPDSANLLQEDGGTEAVDPDDVQIGSVIVVNPGEKIPIDGVVISGSAALDTAALTGESVPRRAHTGEEVKEGEGGEFHFEIRPGIYAHSMLQRVGACCASSAVPYAFRRFCRLDGVDHQGFDISGHQLSLRGCYIGTSELFRRYWLRQHKRYFGERIKLSGGAC